LALYKWDGLDLNGPVDPAKFKTLTVVNKICLVLGKIIDFFGQNPQHS
jgi:hypothetical protein